MRNILLIGVLILSLAGGVSCTNMNKTTQGTLSGAAIGGAAGLGIAAVSGGSLGWGALAGAGAGALAGAIVGHEKERQW